MAQTTRKKKEQSYEAVLEEKKFLGMNSITDTNSINPGEFQLIQNFDIFAGPEGDYIKTRRGSQYLKAASGPSKYAATVMQDRITWDVGAEEYLITQAGTGMFAQALITTGNPVPIALAVGGGFALGSTAQADLFISGDKLYVLHPSGNYVIRWTGSVFVAYPMGLTLPYILAITSANAGLISGSYTLGLEKVYQSGGVDLMASTPNRKIPTTRILAVTGTISAKKIKFTIQATELDNDSLWTHLRVWRSKNKNADNTDPLNPIDAQGDDDELYEEALITKAEIGAGALTAIATGAALPPGNTGVTAGKPAGVYTVELNNADAVLFNLVGLERIELLPIPACTIGCFCANRIFFSGVQDASLDDASKSNIWYSNYAGTKYAFQYNPLNFVDTGRDGQNMVKLIAFEKDLIGIKEAKTGRLPSGNVNIPYQTLDGRIGISHKNFATFIPTIGLVAVTSDYGDFRIFGYDLRWTDQLNGMDISIPVRYNTSGMTGSTTFFSYVNGKIFIYDGTSQTCLVLHVKEGRGWTRYAYPIVYAGILFSFAQQSRIAVLSRSSYLVEAEIASLNSDISTNTEAAVTTPVYFYTRPFRSNNGKDIIEHEYLSIEGSFPSGAVNVYTLTNGAYWPTQPPYPTGFNLTPDAAIFGLSGTEKQEYRLYVQPSTIGAFKWCPLVGNYLTYALSTTSPCTIRSIALHCIVDENGQAWGAFDPFQQFPTTNTDPTWAQ